MVIATSFHKPRQIQVHFTNVVFASLHRLSRFPRPRRHAYLGRGRGNQEDVAEPNAVVSARPCLRRALLFTNLPLR